MWYMHTWQIFNWEFTYGSRSMWLMTYHSKKLEPRSTKYRNANFVIVFTYALAHGNRPTFYLTITTYLKVWEWDLQVWIQRLKSNVYASVEGLLHDFTVGVDTLPRKCTFQKVIYGNSSTWMKFVYRTRQIYRRSKLGRLRCTLTYIYYNKKCVCCVA